MIGTHADGHRDGEGSFSRRLCFQEERATRRAFYHAGKKAFGWMLSPGALAGRLLRASLAKAGVIIFRFCGLITVAMRKAVKALGEQRRRAAHCVRAPEGFSLRVSVAGLSDGSFAGGLCCESCLTSCKKRT